MRQEHERLTVVCASFDAVYDGGAVFRLYAVVERFFQRSGVDVDSIIQISSVDWHLRQ